MATKTQTVTTEQVATTQVPADTKAITEWTQEQKDAAVKKHGSWSNTFRALILEGYTRGQVAKLTGKRYQHVRNVLITPVAKKSASVA